MELYIILGVVALVLSYAIFLRPLLQRKGYLKEDNVEFARQWLQVIRLIIGELKFNDVETRDKTLMIYDATMVAVNYIRYSINVKDIEELKELAYIAVVDALEELKIELDEKDMEIIKVSVDAALEHVKL
jgi:hypothetical protein